MKIFDLRRYIFANITAFIGYIPIIATVIYNMYPHEPYNPNNLVDENIIVFVIIAMCMQTVFYTVILTLFEIIVRKFLIEKKFPDFKINFKLNIPKYVKITLNIIYTTLFCFGMFISCLLFIGAIMIMTD